MRTCETSADERCHLQETRQKLLEDKPGQAPNWMSRAAGQVFLGDLAAAVRSIEAYEGITQAEVRPSVLYVTVSPSLVCIVFND